jgi:hypothetical protein
MATLMYMRMVIFVLLYTYVRPCSVNLSTLSGWLMK